MKFWWNT